MRIIWRDYVAMNWRDLGRKLITVLGFWWVIISITLLLKLSKYSPSILLEAGLPLAIKSTTIICLLGFFRLSLDAWVTGRRLAREAGMPLNEYVKSELYQQTGKKTLKRIWIPISWS